MSSGKAALLSLLVLTLVPYCLHSTMAAPARDVDPTRLPDPQKRLLRDLTCDAITSDNVDKYAPVEVECPKDQTWIRPADSVSPEERGYLKKRRPLLEEKWVQRIEDAGLRAPPRLPVVGMALSGGGYRAMISGAGMAFQSNETAGNVGDLLGLSSYVSGLSGGSWAVSSFYANNDIPPTELANNVSRISQPSCEVPLTPWCMSDVGLVIKPRVSTMISPSG